MQWSDARTLHDRAVHDLVTAAERVTADRWMQPRADGKWSPAEIIEHLTLAYDVLQRELEGGQGMRIRVKLWLRILLRLTVMRRILRGGPFPKNAPAPREIRPATANADQRAAIAGFRERSAKFLATADAAHAAKRRVVLTHPYFGQGGLTDGLVLSARHIEHHRAQLPL
jgi:hypothetical protein